MAVRRKRTLFISFSGGRTSAYMVEMLIKNYSHKYHFVVLFANTGQEHDETLEFVRKCDEKWGGIVQWLEAVVNPEKGKGTKYRLVDFETCTRSHEIHDETPFAQVIRKYGIPGPATPQICTRELKGAVMQSYRSQWQKEHDEKCLNAIGIRTDEMGRLLDEAGRKKFKVVYPLTDWFPTNKEDVLSYWEDQEFDLQIPEHLGNCVSCWKKSDAKHVRIIKSHPEFYRFFHRMEKYHKQTNNKEGHDDRLFFRLNRTVDEMFVMAESVSLDNIPIHMNEVSGGCSESCEASSVDTLEYIED